MIDNRNALKSSQERSQQAIIGLLIIMVLGLLGVLAYATSQGQITGSVVGIGLLIAGASVLIGGLLGFLFGIPRTLQSDALDNNSRAVAYRANTNLEQISDWLTKILVGVGLTQISALPETLGKLSEAVKAGLGNQDNSPVFGLAIILYYLVAGFLFGFLWTRLILPGAFREADASSVKDEIDVQQSRDTQAYMLAMRQLEPRPGSPAPDFQELQASIKDASALTKILIVERARAIRKDNWSTNKERMATCIPVFRALIASDDPSSPHHDYYGQLGFALKDMPRPNWKEAENQLTTAIKVRGGSENGYLYYEMNRGICIIMQDDNYNKRRTSSDDVKRTVLNDLRTSFRELQTIWPVQPIEDWLQLNKITFDELKQ